MFKSGRWRNEKNKIKALFKLHFLASEVPKSGWDALMVVLIPTDVGRPTVRSDKAAVVDGSCRWSTVYETVKLSLDAKTGKVHDKIYQFLISAPGSTKGGILGEASVNLGEYAEAFKPSSVTLPLKGNTTGAVLHVTIQRMVGDDEGREVNENGEMAVRPRRRTLQSQLSKFDDDDAERPRNGTDSKDGSVRTNNSYPIKFASSRNLPLNTDSTESNLQKSHSFDAISEFDSDNNSSGRFAFTPKGVRENGALNSTSSYISPLSHVETPQKLLASSGDWSASTDGGSTSNSGEAAGSQDSEENVEKLRAEVVALSRKADLSDLELQTLRKQIVKENRRVQDLFREIKSVKEERDGYKRECDELKRRSDVKSYKGDDQQVTLEEIKRELSVEKSSNSSLRLQLQNLQDSNSELLLEIKDLEEILEERNREILCLKDQCEFAAPNKENGGGLKKANSLEKTVVELTSELELYRKDREDMEMQMEQLALDYEILKQENHDVTSRLEQTQLRESLRMQYECSSHLAMISELESHVESLEREIGERNEGFEAEMANLMDQKVEQERRAINAEEALRKARLSSSETAERLQEEFKTLYTQVTSMFDSNERVVVEARREADELREKKVEMEEKLRKKEEEIGSVHEKYKVKIQQLLSLVEFKAKEVGELGEELKAKAKDFEDQKKDLKEEMVKMRNEMVKAAKEKEEELLEELREIKALNEEKEGNLCGVTEEVEMLRSEIQRLREETQCCQLERSVADMRSENENRFNLNEQSEFTGTTCKNASETCEPIVSKERGYIELLKDMASLKEKNSSMELELKEMQERYSELSLKFAEVEGERQQLVMRIRSLKNAMKN